MKISSKFSFSPTSKTEPNPQILSWEVPKFHFREMKFLFQSLLSFSLSSSLSLLQYQLFFSASRSMKILSLCSFILSSGVSFFHLLCSFSTSSSTQWSIMMSTLVSCLSKSSKSILIGGKIFSQIHFSKKSFCGCFFATSKMWFLKSFSKVVVAGPFKSEAEMAKKLGVSQQFVNRKIRKHDRVFFP